jgi:hypothetical protein
LLGHAKEQRVAHKSKQKEQQRERKDGTTLLCIKVKYDDFMFELPNTIVHIIDPIKAFLKCKQIGTLEPFVGNILHAEGGVLEYPHP